MMGIWNKNKGALENFKELGSLLMLIAAVFGLLSGIVAFIFEDQIKTIKHLFEYSNHTKKVEKRLNQIDLRIKADSLNLLDYRNAKPPTMAVGLRVGQDGILWYRHTDKILHRAYRDPESSWEGYDFYVWYDNEGNKNYCY